MLIPTSLQFHSQPYDGMLDRSYLSIKQRCGLERHLLVYIEGVGLKVCESRFETGRRAHLGHEDIRLVAREQRLHQLFLIDPRRSDRLRNDHRRLGYRSSPPASCNSNHEYHHSSQDGEASRRDYSRTQTVPPVSPDGSWCLLPSVYDSNTSCMPYLVDNVVRRHRCSFSGRAFDHGLKSFELLPACGACLKMLFKPIPLIIGELPVQV